MARIRWRGTGLWLRQKGGKRVSYIYSSRWKAKWGGHAGRSRDHLDPTVLSEEDSCLPPAPTGPWEPWELCRAPAPKPGDPGYQAESPSGGVLDPPRPQKEDAALLCSQLPTIRWPVQWQPSRPGVLGGEAKERRMCGPESLSQEPQEICPGKCHGTNACSSRLSLSKKRAGMVTCYMGGHHATLGGLGPGPTTGQQHREPVFAGRPWGTGLSLWYDRDRSACSLEVRGSPAGRKWPGTEGPSSPHHLPSPTTELGVPVCQSKRAGAGPEEGGSREGPEETASREASRPAVTFHVRTWGSGLVTSTPRDTLSKLELMVPFSL